MRPSLLPGLIAGGAPQPRPRRGIASACSRSAAAISPMPSGRRCRCCSPASGGRAAGKRQGAGVRRFRRQGRGAGAAGGGRRAGRQSADIPRRGPDLAPGPVGHASAWAEDDRRELRRASPAACARPRRARGAVAAEIYLDAIPAPRVERPGAAGLRPAGAAAGHARLRFHRAGRARRPTQLRPRDPRRRQGGDHRTSGCSTGSKPPTACRSRSKSRFSPTRRASPRQRSPRYPRRIVAAAEKLGARLRS